MWRALYAAIFGAPTLAPAQTVAAVPTVIADIGDKPAARIRRPEKHQTPVHKLPIEDALHVDLGEGTGWSIGIVGESHRQTALRDLSAGRRRRDEPVHFLVALIPEPTNPYDANAIRVDILRGDQVGYLARDDAAAYGLVLTAVTAAGKLGVCRAKLIGGTAGKPSLGVVIDLGDPHVLLARFGQPF